MKLHIEKNLKQDDAEKRVHELQTQLGRPLTPQAEFDATTDIKTLWDQIEILEAVADDRAVRATTKPPGPVVVAPKTVTPVTPPPVAAKEPAKVEAFKIGDTKLTGINKAIVARAAELEARK